MQTDLKICKNCVMDTSDKTLTFDENGVCPRCNEYEQRIVKWWNHGNGHEEELNKILAEVKKSGEGKEYDCILGLSGGLDSSYMLHLAVKEWGLRPFVFHVDAGWNLPVAESNIKKLCDKLGVELHIERVDFEDMRQLQLAENSIKLMRSGDAATLGKKNSDYYREKFSKAIIMKKLERHLTIYKH